MRHSMESACVRQVKGLYEVIRSGGLQAVRALVIAEHRECLGMRSLLCDEGGSDGEDAHRSDDDGSWGC